MSKSVGRTRENLVLGKNYPMLVAATSMRFRDVLVGKLVTSRK